MKEKEIIETINKLLPNRKLEAVKFVKDLMEEARIITKIQFGYFGLKDAKDSIDVLQGSKNAGKEWLSKIKINYPVVSSKFRFVKILKAI